MPLCLCGHEHELLDSSAYTTDDGARIVNFEWGACEGSASDVVVCRCEQFIPDRFPHVTGLLGLEVRAVIV